MRMRKSASSAVAIAALMSAVVLWGAMPGVALSQTEGRSSAAPTEAAPTLPPLPTEALPVPCTTEPIPTEAATEAVPSDAAPSEAAPSFAESSIAPIASEVVPVESPTESSQPCESAPPSEAPSASEPASAICALLSTDEIATVIGSPVIEASGDDTSCGWASVDPDSATLIIVQDLALSDFDELKSTTLPGMVNTPVSVGDDAFVQTLSDTVITLYMKKGDRAIQVLVVDSDLAANDIVTVETKLAEIIAGRI
jgi:hypothetical protein